MDIIKKCKFNYDDSDCRLHYLVRLYNKPNTFIGDNYIFNLIDNMFNKSYLEEPLSLYYTNIQPYIQNNFQVYKNSLKSLPKEYDIFSPEKYIKYNRSKMENFQHRIFLFIFE